VCIEREELLFEETLERITMAETKDLTNELERIRESDSDIDLLLSEFEEIERIYHESLEAMGLLRKHIPEVENSSRVTISIPPMQSSFAS
jgi:hypothetical protein